MHGSDGGGGQPGTHCARDGHGTCTMVNGPSPRTQEPVSCKEGGTSMRPITRRTVLGMMTSAVGLAALHQVGGRRTVRADTVPGIDARVVAMNIPGASAIAQVGTFLAGGPIPTNFHAFIQ